MKAQGTERAGAPTTFAREVRVRRGLNISDMKSSLVPRPGLSVRGGATSAAVGKDEEVNGFHQFQEVLPHHLSEPLSLVVGLGGDEAAEEQGYPHVVVVLMELRAADCARDGRLLLPGRLWGWRWRVR